MDWSHSDPIPAHPADMVDARLCPRYPVPGPLWIRARGICRSRWPRIPHRDELAAEGDQLGNPNGSLPAH